MIYMATNLHISYLYIQFDCTYFTVRYTIHPTHNTFYSVDTAHCCPQGVKANMKRLYQLVTEAQFNRCSKPVFYRKLLFSLCFFHSILLERKKFLQLGWNIVYGFNDADFEVRASPDTEGNSDSCWKEQSKSRNITLLFSPVKMCVVTSITE